MSDFYTFRFDYEGHEAKLPVLLDYIKFNCSKYVIFNEVAKETKKLHYQGKIMPTKSINTFRRNLLKGFPMFKRSNYSIAPIRKEGYDLYICKDGDVVINNVWTADEINDRQQQFNETADGFAAEAKKKAKPLETWSQRVAKEMEDKIPNVIQTYMNLIVFEELGIHEFTANEFQTFKNAKLNMLEFMLDRMGNAVKTLSKSIINSLFYGVTNHFLMKSNHRKEWVFKIYNKLDSF